ncbi:MAG: hypothetical protein AAF975_03070, partial [Spirochaetota bacterium]
MRHIIFALFFVLPWMSWMSWISWAALQLPLHATTPTPEQRRNSSENPEQLLQLGYQAYHQNNWLDVVKYLSEAALFFPDDDLQYLYLGTAHQILGEDSLAEETLVRGVNLQGPNMQKIAFVLGNYYYSAGRYDKAVDAYNLATWGEEQLVQAFLNRANVYLSHGFYSNALNDYTYFLFRKPFDSQREKIEAVIEKLTALGAEGRIQADGGVINPQEYPFSGGNPLAQRNAFAPAPSGGNGLAGNPGANGNPAEGSAGSGSNGVSGTDGMGLSGNSLGNGIASGANNANQANQANGMAGSATGSQGTSSAHNRSAGNYLGSGAASGANQANGSAGNTGNLGTSSTPNGSAGNSQGNGAASSANQANGMAGNTGSQGTSSTPNGSAGNSLGNGAASGANQANGSAGSATGSQGTSDHNGSAGNYLGNGAASG